jgi:hypothetical protein
MRTLRVTLSPKAQKLARRTRAALCGRLYDLYHSGGLEGIGGSFQSRVMENCLCSATARRNSENLVAVQVCSA